MSNDFYFDDKIIEMVKSKSSDDFKISKDNMRHIINATGAQTSSCNIKVSVDLFLNTSLVLELDSTYVEEQRGYRSDSLLKRFYFSITNYDSSKTKDQVSDTTKLWVELMPLFIKAVKNYFYEQEIRQVMEMDGTVRENIFVNYKHFDNANSENKNVAYFDVSIQKQDSQHTPISFNQDRKESDMGDRLNTYLKSQVIKDWL